MKFSLKKINASFTSQNLLQRYHIQRQVLKTKLYFSCKGVIIKQILWFLYYKKFKHLLQDSITEKSMSLEFKYTNAEKLKKKK